MCNTVNCVHKRCSNKINLRDRKVFNALWQNCENTRWKCLCISAQLCTGYMECSLCRDQSWAVQLKNVYKFRSAYWLQGSRIAITFQWWKIIDGNRNRDGITWPMMMMPMMMTMTKEETAIMPWRKKKHSTTKTIQKWQWHRQWKSIRIHVE